jgi:lipopolysaccharide heptosyltransferase I
MAEILFIKTSSLGDVVHHMPAVTDARRERPGARISWMVEENYAPLVRLHKDVDEVIPVAIRRWRRHPFASSTWREVREFLRTARCRSYDAVIDTQGLARSALLARMVHGIRHGYGLGSIRERIASLAYDARHDVERVLHAVERNRVLTAKVLGYVPGGELDYGLTRGRVDPAAPPYAVFLHGSARREKEWPEQRWLAVGAALRGDELDVVLPSGTAAERNRSERLAAALSNAQAPAQRPLDGIARLIAGATIVIGLDTGLMHLAVAFGVPVVAIFVNTDPSLTGPRGSGPIAVIGGKRASPTAEGVIAAARHMLANRREAAVPTG